MRTRDNSQVTPATNSSGPTRILILGGGFGGLYAALHLDKTFASDPKVEVTLVSRDNYSLITPMLHEVAAGELEMNRLIEYPERD